MDVIKPNDIIHNMYRFEHPIGHGAYGMVWKGYQIHMNKPVAIKVIDIQNLDQASIERVRQECHIGGELSHKAQIVHVENAFPEKGRFFIVMELMIGGSLEHYLRAHPHPDFGLTLHWALALCAALAEVHAKGIIHRDIKPQNILLTDDGLVKLGDFGVSHLPTSSLTTIHQPGTPGYRAPEQEANVQIDNAVDVYSLCAVFFEVWTGSKFIQFKHVEPSIIREEMAFSLAKNYPELSPALREKLIVILLSGLQPRAERISLSMLQTSLVEIQQMWQRAEDSSEAVEKARAQVAQQITEMPQTAQMSNSIQLPKSSISRILAPVASFDWLEYYLGHRYKARCRKWLKILWHGADQAKEGIVAPILVFAQLYLSSLLWGTAVRLAHFQSPVKLASLLMITLSVLVFIWALWGIWKMIRALGLKRLAIALTLLFMIMIFINILTIPDEGPLGPRILSLTSTTTRQIKNGLADWIASAREAPDDFLSTYLKQIRPPELPAGFPTPDPQATPVQAFAHPGNK